MSHKSSDVPTREQLLKSIRIIKGQRQRANLVRISKSMKNHHNIFVSNEKVIVDLLEALVNDGLLTKSWKNDEVAYQEYVQSMPKIYKGPKKSQLYAAIQTIVSRSSEENGMHLKGICEEMKNSDLCRSMNPVLLKYTIKICCLKMVSRELLVRNGSFFKVGNYGCLANSGDEEEEACIVDKAVSDKAPATPTDTCSFCNEKDKIEEEEGGTEQLISCVECGRSGHPSCLQFSKKLTEKVKTLRWQCVECKKCSICAEVTRPDSMLFCDFCDRGFHMDCCKPPINKPPKGLWNCCICEYEKNQRSKNLRILKRGVGSSYKFRKTGGLRKYMKKNKFLHSFRGKNRSRYDSYDDDFNISAYESELFKKTSEEIKNIPEEDKDLFKQCQVEVKEKLLQNATPTTNGQLRRPVPSEIFIGNYRVDAWYSAPYPNGFNKLPQLHICEFCLTFVETDDILKRHQSRCPLEHPPGNEIYRDDSHSVFEVDGNEAKIYSQNLCLLAKLFLDHKTLHYDVEPFLFYVLTTNDSSGCHFVGYFSKEKYCQQKYNLSCIMTLPQYQRYGYGGFLIDFSYALSRREGVSGTPEKPLSDLGHLSYQSYWANVIVERINEHKGGSLSVKGISESTGVDRQDILSTLMSHNLLRESNGKLKIVIDADMLSRHQAKKRRRVKEELLKWTPYTVTVPEVEQQEEQEVKNEEEKNERKLRSPGRCQKNYLNCRSPIKSRNKSKDQIDDLSGTIDGHGDSNGAPLTSTPLPKSLKLPESGTGLPPCDLSDISSSAVPAPPRKRGRPKTKNVSTRPSLFESVRPDLKEEDFKEDAAAAVGGGGGEVDSGDLQTSGDDQTLIERETSRTVFYEPSAFAVEATAAAANRDGADDSRASNLDSSGD